MWLNMVSMVGIWAGGGMAIAVKPLPIPKLMQSQYASYLAEFQTQCPAPHTLETRTITQEQPALKLASFVCWEPQTKGGDRDGQWLGRLPYPQSAVSFALPMTCAPEDFACSKLLTDIRTHHAIDLQRAEFKCATKNGTLFFQQHDSAIGKDSRVELRCGFFDTQLSAPAGSLTQDATERFTSVDFLVATFKVKL